MPAGSNSAKAQRALGLLASPRARLVAMDQGFALFRCEDRRRRPAMHLARAVVQGWIGEGLLRQVGAEGFCLSAAGLELRRARHNAAEGALPAAAPVRLARFEGLEAHEAAALQRLAGDLEAAEAGALRGVDWSAPPKARTGWSGADPLAAGAAARGRAKRALAALAMPLALAAKAVCTERVALDALERRFHWPARSGRLAIKLAAAQLAHHYRFGSPAEE